MHQLNSSSASNRRNAEQETEACRRFTTEAEKESAANRCTRAADPRDECQRLCQANHESVNHADALQRPLARAHTLCEPEQQCPDSYGGGNNEWCAHGTLKNVARCEAEKNGRDRADHDRNNETLVGRITAMTAKRGEGAQCNADESQHVASKCNEYGSERPQVNNGAEGERREKRVVDAEEVRDRIEVR